MPTTKYDELYDGRVACTHRSFTAKHLRWTPDSGKGQNRPFSTTRITRSRKVVQRPTWPPEPRIWPTGLRRRISHKITSTGYYGTHHYSLRVSRLGISDDEPCRDTKRTLIFFFWKEQRRASPDHMSGTDTPIIERRARSAQTLLGLTH